MNRFRLGWLLSIFALTVLVAVDSLFAGVKVEEGITYGKGGTQNLLLDLAQPDHATGLMPALVYIHGGGWVAGDRKGYRKDIEDAANRGYVAVSIEYRLTEPDKAKKAKYPFPAQVEDVKCAVRWLRANADKYHVDPHRIGAIGGSAGGHLSLMLGLTDSSAGLEGNGGNPTYSSRVQAVVNYFGPTDLARLHSMSKHAADLMEIMLGGPPDKVPEAYRAASPITYVSKDDPPVLTLQGAADAVVVPDQATLLDAAMKKAGVPHTLIMLEGQGHGFKGAAAQKAHDATFKFFDQHLKMGL